jgi:hypothetical protein
MPLPLLLTLLWELVYPLLFLGGILVFAPFFLNLHDLWLQCESRSQGDAW